MAVTVIVALPLAEFEQLPIDTLDKVYVYTPGVLVDTGNVTELLVEVVVIVCDVAVPETVYVNVYGGVVVAPVAPVKITIG